MKTKTIADTLSKSHGEVPTGTAASSLRANRVIRFLRNRGTHSLEGAVVAKFVSTRAHNFVLSPAGLELERPSAQPPALSAWEDEGGQVQLQTKRAKKTI
jgi:hypothetical protein